MSQPTYAIDIDLDADGVLAESGEDVSADVRSSPGITTVRGAAESRPLGPPAAGSAELDLDNVAGSYNPSSNVKRGRALRIRATFSGTTYNVFRGALEKPVHRPEPGNRSVELEAFGPLAKLAGQRVSTALYQSLRVDEALAHLLDAAEYPKNLVELITDDLATNLRFYYQLSNRLGFGKDSSPNGNDGTATVGIGGAGKLLHDTNDPAGTETSLEFDGLSTRVAVTDAAALQNIWDTGGTLFWIMEPQSDGEADFGQIVNKEPGWRLHVGAQSGTNVQISFLVGFSGSTPFWQTAVNIPVDVTSYCVLVYDNDPANDPIIYIYDATNGFRTLTVGSGLTEGAAPVGTRTTDVGSDMVIGNRAAADWTFDGYMAHMAGWNDPLTAQQAKDLIFRAVTAARYLDQAKSSLLWWGGDFDDALKELARLRNTEGPASVVYEDGAGRLVFKHRHARLNDIRSTVVQTTFRGTGTEPLHSAPFVYDDGLADLVNEARITVKTRAAEALGVVWTLGQTVVLGPNQVRTVFASDSGGDPITAAVTPVLNTDYTVGGGVTVTLGRTSGGSIPILLTAGAAGAMIYGLQLRGQVVAVTNETQAVNTVSAAASITENGLHPYTLDVVPEISEGLAKLLCDAIVHWYKDGRPKIAITVNNGNATRLTAGLVRDISDLIRVIEANHSIDKNIWIERITRLFSGQYHETRYAGETATVIDRFTLNSSALNSGKILWY